MGHIKGLTTIRVAAQKSFEAMPDKFSGLYFTRVARLISGRKFAFEDTFFRRLRELRQEGALNYKCTDTINSCYVKLAKS